MISPIDFLKEIHPNPDERICIICIFPDDRRENISKEKQRSAVIPIDVDERGKFIYRPHPLFIAINLWLKRKEVIGKFPLLHALNKNGWGIYYSVSGFGEKLNKWGRIARDRENVRRIQVLFADFDEPTETSRAFEAGQGFDLLPPPNFIIRTSENKLQVIWLVERPMAFKTAEASLLYISTKTGSDPAVKDLPRVLRLPGFKNTKLKSGDWSVTVKKLHDQRLDNALVESLASAGRNISTSSSTSTLVKEERVRPSSSSPERGESVALKPALALLTMADIGPVPVGRALEHRENIYKRTENQSLADWGMCSYLRGVKASADTMMALLMAVHGDDGRKGNEEYYRDTIRHCMRKSEDDRSFCR